jgi:aminopeptidase N
MRPYIILALLTFCTSLSLEAQKIDVYSWPERDERARTYDVLHYRIELRFDEDARSYWGDTTITLTAFEDNFSTCILDAETFVVDKIVDQASRTLEFEQGDGRLTVHLAEPIDYRKEVSFTVSYSATNVDVEADKYGLSATYDLGLDFEEASACCPRIIKTASWPEGARHWFPSYDHPNDRATQEVLATVRENYKVLSNGRLVGVTDGPQPGTKTWHWSQEQTHPTYLFVLVAGPYVVIEDSLGDLPINYWVYGGDRYDAMRSFYKTPQIIEFFNEEFDYPYPWAKYDQITVHGHSGGMESTTATVLGRGTIHDERAEQDFPSHSLVAHEAAHMWWGDLVTYRAWKETWLSESFATYSEYLFNKHDLGEDEGAVNLLGKKDAYLREAHTDYMRPIVFDRWRYPNDNFDAHTYPKGAVILNMLRWIMGDDNFRHAISHFLHKHAFQPVDTHDFTKAVKEATGQNIDWFMEQWIFRPGHPVFDVSYDWDEDAKKVVLTIRQMQDTSGDIPIYRTPVVIGIHAEGGKTSKRLWLEKQKEVFELDVDEKPLLVRFDEGNYLLKEWTFEKTTDELLYQLENDDVIGRMWAASELAKHDDDPRTITALVAAAKGDPFWAVRRSAVETLGKIDGKGQTAFLEEKTRDASSKVRVAALEALGNTVDTRLIDFFKARFEADDSYLAQAEALRSIGKTGDRSAVAFLEEAQGMSSPRNVIERAASWALERIER